ncbi:YwqG family protein [Streptomonospora litoralis]|uniref:DUF1963 domain-containing protein n=1 Tax=Streptomonospora litoralis TaxID=2498135 RepID=A0A4P6Q741_9ACTN|nr:hypothetical protein [Streptomonospora litoralis]QBI56608.1 hypothetical protein EKD16_24320 [Streptomonospora litoralis]
MNPTSEMLDKLGRLREEIREVDIPSEDVEQWIATARPCARLDAMADGPVVGRLGGPLMLPADAPDPWCRLAATLDLAALPAYATNLPLPPDGHLLLFARPNPEMIGRGTLGSALHIPAGTRVEERRVDLDPGPGNELYGVEFPEGRLRLRSTGVSLPEHSEVHDPGPPPATKRFPDDDCTSAQMQAWEEVREAWGEIENEIVHPGLQLGGYALDEFCEEDPAVRAGREAAQAEAKGELPKADTDIRPEDWVCLAQWWHGLKGLEMALYSWSIARQDLAAGRFDRVYATMTWNP